MVSSTRHTTGTKLEPKLLRRVLIELRQELLGKHRPERHCIRRNGRLSYVFEGNEATTGRQAPAPHAQ